MLFSDNAKIAGRGAIFKQSSCRGAIVQKRLKTTGVEYRIIQKVLHSLKHFYRSNEDVLVTFSQRIGKKL